MLGLGLALSLFGCGRSSERKMGKSAMLDEAQKNVFSSSSAAVENGKDTTRRFIRTAELKFKVKSVVESTYDIENITSQQGGFVAYTNLTSSINDVTNTAISQDSSLETTYYTVTNSITLRVPNTKLDTTLREIAKHIDYLDYRIIKAENVALQLLSNNLTQQRSKKNEERLTHAIDNKGKKLSETTAAEEVLLDKQEQADNAKIANLSLEDQIKFSTINLAIYQREAIKRELIPNDKNIEAYEPSFGTKLVEALNYGWHILETFLVFLIKFWTLFLFAILVYFMYKKYGGKSKKM